MACKGCEERRRKLMAHWEKMGWGDYFGASLRNTHIKESLANGQLSQPSESSSEGENRSADAPPDAYC